MVLLAGCASNTQIPLKQIPTFNTDLYGLIEKQNGQYQFTKFSKEISGISNPWVRLSDMQPAWNTSKETCLIGLAKASLNCQTDNDALFRYKGTDFTPKKTAAYTFLGVLSFGLWFTMPPGSVEFDENAFNSAVSNALKNKQLGNRLNNAIQKYDQLRLSVKNQYDTPIINSPKLNRQVGEARLIAIEKAIDKAYKALNFKVVDRSDYFSKKVTKQDIVTPQITTKGTPKFVSPKIESYTNESTTMNDIFPVENIDELEQKLVRAEKDITYLKNINNTRNRTNFQVVEKSNLANQVLMSDYLKYLDEEELGLSWIKSPNTVYLLQNTEYDLRLPSNTKISAEKANNKIASTLTIKGVNFSDVLPKYYKHQNPELSTQLNGEIITLNNTTDSFITIDAISLYHEGKVLTTGKDDDYQNLYEMAPKTIKRISISKRFRLDSLDTTYNNLTLDRAQKTKISFGFAIKYRVTESDRPKTIYKEQVYKLSDLLKQHRLATIQN